jgi:protein-L-isoaspartate(D-aspartate) O-methyltransferase
LNAGAADKGPYDLIIIDGAVEVLPDAIKAQLKDGGRIVTGLCDGPARTVWPVLIRHGDHVALRTIADTEIAPLPGFARAREFSF